MRIRRTLATAFAATALAVAGPWALGATAAQAAPMQQGPDALVLVVSGPAEAAVPGNERAVTLGCAPTASGDHPRLADACGALLGVGGDIAQLPPRQMLCPDIYLPVTATAVGVWQGNTLFYQHTFANRCMMLRSAGEVFDF
jgi:hypothetical protein